MNPKSKDEVFDELIDELTEEEAWNIFFDNFFPETKDES